MLREEIITSWQVLKAKINSYQPIKEIQSLLTELSELSQQVQNKKWKISQITGHCKYIGELPSEEQEQIEELDKEIDQLYQETIPLKENLSNLNPLWGKKEVERLTKETEELERQLRYSYQAEDESAKLRDIREMNRLNVGYEERTINAEQRYIKLEAKLERVRELVSEGKIEKLKVLCKEGSI